MRTQNIGIRIRNTATNTACYLNFSRRQKLWMKKVIFVHFQGLQSVGGISGRNGAKWVTVTILVYVNLINYMDRLTIAGKWKLALQTLDTAAIFI
jgi:hypothetical protein